MRHKDGSWRILPTPSPHVLALDPWYAGRRGVAAARVLSLCILILRSALVHCAASLNRSPTIELFPSIVVFAATSILMYGLVRLGMYRLG